MEKAFCWGHSVSGRFVPDLIVNQEHEFSRELAHTPLGARVLLSLFN